jgi:hypothetical protein
MNRQEKEKVALDGNITNNCAAINNNALFFFFGFAIWFLV